jgi:alpha-L-rhamnosidase
MIKALTELGFSGLMHRIAGQPDYPGWGDWIEKGATTLWQTWEGDMSLNHIMFGSIGEWFYHSLGGIRPDPEVPGFRHFILKPEPVDSLDWVESSYESVYGKIISNWKNTGETFDWEIKVPVNTTARVHLPYRPDGVILESGEEITENENFRIVEKHDAHLILEVQSGVYNFRVQ